MKKVWKSIPFTKMAGTGNDFIVLDNRSRCFSGRERDLFRSICERRTSVGADGILLLERSKSAAVRMRYFNPDGGESTMCGNGARCSGYYARRYGWTRKDQFMLEAHDGLHSVSVAGSQITLGMIPPVIKSMTDQIVREKGFKQAGFVDTGVPHFVIFVKDLNSLPVDILGPYYRLHTIFPDGANVDFVKIAGPGTIHVRTYERGVERETLSCGTGCVASAFFASNDAGLKSPITVETRGGELKVDFDEAWREVQLTGPVKIVYEGRLRIESMSSE